MQRRIVPHVVDGSRPITAVTPETTILEVARRLRQSHVAAALVTEGERLVGIVTERDITYRVVAEGRDPGRVTAREVMTADPVVGHPGMTAGEALELMRSGHFRHLPILRDGRPFAVVSIRDLYEAVRSTLEEELQEAEHFIQGEAYGTGV